MAETSRRRATYQDVLDAPADKIAEVINGELRLSPQPRLGHQSVSSNLGVELGAPFGRGRGGPGGWIFLDEPELHLGEDILVPDIAGWRRERLPSLDGDAGYLTLAPDWLCEVLSPSTETMDRADKLPIYAAHGVGHVWLINPRQRTLEVLRLHEGKWLTLAVHRDDQRVRVEPFDAIEIDLAMLWADLSGTPLRASEGAAPYGDYERVL
jgi:Uma2 family endonuclease